MLAGTQLVPLRCQRVQAADEGVVMRRMVDPHRHGVDMRLERFIGNSREAEARMAAVEEAGAAAGAVCAIARPGFITSPVSRQHQCPPINVRRSMGIPDDCC